jgi:hypothetical protein
MKNTKHYICGEETFKLKDTKGNKYSLEVKTDDFASNPREWSNVSTMICWYRNRSLGDSHTFANPYEFMQHLYLDITGKHWTDEYESDDWEDIYAILKASDLILIKLLRVYEHGDITISTSDSYPYNDYWDASIVGFVYIKKKTAFKELVGYVLDENGERIKEEHKHPNGQSTWSYKTEPLTDDTWKDRADEVIEAEVKTFDNYLTNNVYEFTLSKINPIYGCGECSETIDVTELLSNKQLALDEKVHYICPHCGADLGNDVDVSEPLNIEVIEEEEEIIEELSGFYGDCLEENGILAEINVGSDLTIIN